MEFVVIRKLIAALVAFLLAKGVVKCEPVQKRLWLQIVLYIVSALLVVFAMMYHFGEIPKENTDMLLKRLI